MTPAAVRASGPHHWPVTSSDWAAVAAGLSAVAALLLLRISLRQAKATDEAAIAQRRSADTTDALHRIKIERGHDNLGPRVELAWVPADDAGSLAVEVTNLGWRGYRFEAVLIRQSGRSRQIVATAIDLPSRGVARIFPEPTKNRSPQEIRQALTRLVSEAVVELAYRADELWHCPCGRPDEYGHWREGRQLPTPTENHFYGFP